MTAMPFEFFVVVFAVAGYLLYYGLTRGSFPAALLGCGAFIWLGAAIGSDGIYAFNVTGQNLVALTYANSSLVRVLSQAMIIGGIGTIMFAVLASVYNHIQS
jgi:hypothetical protein